MHKSYKFGSHPRGIVFCDWLQLSGHAKSDPDRKEPPSVQGYIISRQEYGSNVFKWRDILYTFEGAKLATILYAPKNPNIPRDIISFQIANNVLYVSEEYITEIVNVVCAAYEISLPTVALSRIDLCCDFEIESSMLHTLIDLAAGKVYAKGKASFLAWWQAMECVNADPSDVLPEKIPYTITLGSKSSVFTWKIYYKFKELQEESDKPYIRDHWRNFGFDEECVWRCEVSISKLSHVLYEGAEFDWATIIRERTRIFASLYNDKMQLREDQGHANKRHDPERYILKMHSLDKLFTYKQEHDGRIYTEPQLRYLRYMLGEVQKDEVRNSGWLYEKYVSELRGALEDAIYYEYIRTHCDDELFTLLSLSS